MAPQREVVFDAFPDSPLRYRDHDAVVCIDVISTTTTLVTAAASGRRVFPVANAAELELLARSLERPLLAGEAGSAEMLRFDVGNRPAAIAQLDDVGRPIVLLGSAGTALIANARGCAAVYVACLRNLTATAAWLHRHHSNVAVLAASSRGQLRCEDQMAAGWIVERLLAEGFHAADNRTEDLARRWSGTSVAIVRWGNSAEELRRAGSAEDLEFILEHVDDLGFACIMAEGEVRCLDLVEKPLALGPGLGRRVMAVRPAPLAFAAEPGAGRRHRVEDPELTADTLG